MLDQTRQAALEDPILEDPIYITRPYLPPLAEYLPMLEAIWSTRVLTNCGPFHEQFEARLSGLFEGAHVSLTSNGMQALALAIEAAELEGEVITTPYSFVATTHSVKMGKLTPVFVDIDPSDLNVDTAAIEAAITPRTTAIVAVHCYGNPCDLTAIEVIARKHDLTVIYDAAHAFGVRYQGNSLCAQGDYSALSFHATKAFNTFEGGAVVTRSASAKARMDLAKNFGIVDETNIPSVGINAKMSEFSASLGLLQLDHFLAVKAAREAIDTRYREVLAGVAGLDPIAIPDGVESNYSYFPVLVGAEYPLTRDELYDWLKTRGIFARRYFYPLLSALPMYCGLPSAGAENLPVATDAAQRVLCLPIYPDLTEAEQSRVIDAILSPIGQVAQGCEMRLRF